MPAEHEDLGTGRASGETEATQMEFSPAPTISKHQAQASAIPWPAGAIPEAQDSKDHLVFAPYPGPNLNQDPQSKLSCHEGKFILCPPP